MYIYNQVDQKIVDQRVSQFRDQTRRFLAGDLSEDEYRPLRLMNGVYVQIHAPMLRVAIPYGLLSSVQLRMLAQISRKYDKNYGHLTTRQNIQFNWPQLENVPDILADLSTVQMHAMQTSGNCIRNISTDHLAGIAKDEIEDPRPYCEIIRQWSTLHPEFAYLPRKFKFAVIGSERDRAATQVHDIGIHLVKNNSGEIGFKILVGGGLGRTPILAKVINPFLAKQDLISYLEAILRVYNQLGRRDNIYRARIKILVKELGIEKIRELVDNEWQHLRNTDLTLPMAEIKRMQDFFFSPPYEQDNTIKQPGENASFSERKLKDNAFAQWTKYNLAEHKIAGYSSVYISLKAPEIPPGDITDEQMDHVADLADQYSFGLIRTTHRQNLVLSDVKQSDLYSLWLNLKTHELATPNIGTFTDMICCPGLDFCSLANASAIDVANELNRRFDKLDYLYDLGQLKLNISGCMNACGHQDVGHIGILGVSKKGQEWYQITLGGSSENDASLGERLGRSIAKDKIVTAIDVILKVYLDKRFDDEEFLDTYRRIGMGPFKERVYNEQ